MKRKVKEWLKRYLPAEILSVIATLLAGAYAFHYSENRVSAALAATWAGNIAYFGYILCSDIFQTKATKRAANKTYKATDLLKNLRALLLEFGIAEIFDTLLIRPALMYYLPVLLNNLTWGLLLAKFAADVTFYIPAIISYERTKKRFRDFH